MEERVSGNNTPRWNKDSWGRRRSRLKAYDERKFFLSSAICKVLKPWRTNFYVNVAPILVSGQYLLVSGGDDAALYAAEFNLKQNKNDVTKVHVTREVSEPFAHTSSVTGNNGSTSFLGSSLFYLEKGKERPWQWGW